MPVAKIQTFGPKEVYEGRIQRYEYYAEARGADGRSYYAASRARPTPLVDAQERFREMTAALLETRMKQEGVWPDEDQPGQP
jgi:hypothetical protein